MGDLSLEKVSETYLDVLKEIGNIGAGNAMTADVHHVKQFP